MSECATSVAVLGTSEPRKKFRQKTSTKTKTQMNALELSNNGIKKKSCQAATPAKFAKNPLDNDTVFRDEF